MKKKTIALYSLAAIVAFLGFVIARLPANLVLAYAAEQTKMIVPIGVEGTIWNGSANNIILQVQGRDIPLGVAEWDISFLSLLTGKLNADIKASYGNQLIEGNAVLSSAPSITMTDMHLVLESEAIENYVPLARLVGSPIDMKVLHDGLWDVQVSDFSWEVDKLTAFAAKGSVTQLKVQFLEELGTLAGEMQLDGEDIAVRFFDIDASIELDVSGTVNPLTKQANLTGSVKPKEEASDFIKQGLTDYKSIFKKQPDGSYQFKYPFF